MNLIVMIDLDDTLLVNDIEQFLKHYFKRLSDILLPWVTADRMMAAMMAATQAMQSKTLPALTLEEQFDQVFYPQIGVPKDQLKDTIDTFYSVEFPKLRDLTAPQPNAVQLIKAVKEHGWKIVIATNPLFPRTAIEQRLEWAGLPSGEIGFDWVTSYENSHFCKPHTAYYAEILGRLGWLSEPVVMVGNSIEHDILPAQKLGIPTFWLHESGNGNSSQTPMSSFGAIDDILPWLEKISMESPSPDFQSMPAVLATLQSTPAVMETLTRGLPAYVWSHRPADNEWNVIEILAHLRDVDREVNLGRIEQTIRGENPFLPGTNTDSWVQERNYAAEPGPKALKGFLRSRTELLALISNASGDQLAQPARHAIFGPTTLKELLGFIATHDRTHIRQAINAIRIEN